MGSTTFKSIDPRGWDPVEDGIFFFTIMHSTVFEDNKEVLELDTSPRKPPRTRHIAIKYHFFREHVCEGNNVMIQRVESKAQKADLFIKKDYQEKHYTLHQEVTRRMLIVIIQKQGRERI